jgi:hypothetical protein
MEDNKPKKGRGGSFKPGHPYRFQKGHRWDAETLERIKVGALAKLKREKAAKRAHSVASRGKKVAPSPPQVSETPPLQLLETRSVTATVDAASVEPSPVSRNTAAEVAAALPPRPMPPRVSGPWAGQLMANGYISPADGREYGMTMPQTSRLPQWCWRVVRSWRKFRSLHPSLSAARAQFQAAPFRRRRRGAKGPMGAAKRIFRDQFSEMITTD